jgi:hypothetical protein
MIVSLTIVRYPKICIPFALLAMALHRLPMHFKKGCSFWRLLGTGRKGTFDLYPDWQQWGLLACWDDRGSFDRFSRQSFISKWWKFFRTEQWTILCEPLQSHGSWDGREPFNVPVQADYQGPLVVLTRATVRFNRLKNFWANADTVSAIMSDAKGLIASFGIGEMPVYRQATFSVWDNVESMRAFAYQSAEHIEVIRKTKEEAWYSEELFARFKPIAAFGTLHHTDPLKGIITFDES